MKHFKVGIIGGGPGGYVTAIRLQQYGIKAAVFEKERLGGVCLNCGCIPTKALVKVAHTLGEIDKAAELGISVEKPSLDFTKAFSRKSEVVEKLVSGVEFMFKKRKIETINENVISLKKEKNSYIISSDKNDYSADILIIATGSRPKQLPNIKFDGDRILSSRHLLNLKALPKNLTVIGGGVIGCEFASIFNRFGSQVEIVEFLPNLINTEDREIKRRLAMALKKAGIKIHLKTAVESLEENGKNLLLNLSNGKQITTEKVLLSVGREPVWEINTENFQLKTENGFLIIDEMMRTNEKSIFAIGDVTGKSMLAHTASKQGLLVAEKIKSIQNDTEFNNTLNYDFIPACTFTEPEIGSAGLTEQQAKEKYDKILIGKFPFTANGKALGLGETFGFVKTIADDETKKIIGIHIIGPQATELIAPAGILIGTRAKIEDVSKVIFAHPTLSEALMESIEDLENLAIHKL